MKKINLIELEKQQEELKVFKKFISKTSLKIDLSSARNCQAPEPDIQCTYRSGEPVYFELTRALNTKLAQFLYGGHRSGDCDFIQKESYEDIIFKKNAILKESKYQLNCQRVELLVYLGAQPFIPFWFRTIPRFLEKNAHQWMFKRIWIFDDFRERVIIRFPY